MKAEQKMYCLGFVFNTSGTSVLLIRKGVDRLYPGKWNGVGGHVEKNETPLDSMVRECDEELNLKGLVWTNVASLEDAKEEWVVFVYGAVHKSLLDAYSSNDEKIFAFPLVAIPDLELAPHTSGLIHMAWDRIKDQSPFVYVKEGRR